MQIHLRHISRVALLIVLLAPASALAQQTQDTAKLGVIATAPSAIGVIYQVTPTIAVRPEIGFAFSHTESTTGPGTGIVSASMWNPGASVLFYVGKADKLRTYVAPRYAYTHNHSENTSPTGTVTTSNTSSHTISGTFGAELALHAQFGAFGEVGLSFNHTGNNNNSGVSGYSWSHRAVVGAIFYF